MTAWEAELHNILCGESEHTGLKSLIFRLGAVQDGAVDIHSDEGKGTKVSIYLPAERSSE